MNHRATFIPSPEVDLLLTCARLHVDTPHMAHARRLAEDNSIDWSAVYTLAQRHGVIPLLARHLPQIAPANLPNWLLPRLQGDYATIAQHNLLRARALVSLARHLREDGIDAVFYKGAITASTLYGDLALRSFGDVDVLIRPEDLWQVRDLMLAQGYSTDFQPADAAQAQRENCEWHFHHVPSRLTVDLHWHVVPDTFAALLDEDALWARAEDAALLPGAPVTTLGALDQLLVLALNGAKTCWHDLKCIGDVAAWLHRHGDWDWEKSRPEITRLGSRRVLLVSV
ncbi:MAG: nucleotidyltransferase family protein, partial [Caldilineaceae bacterium]|nr:nucleotidyltransferase family protein [Caldilineaceae bacterium]